jgi:hypothetical protein
MSSTGTMTWMSSSLRGAGVDDGDRPGFLPVSSRPARKRAISSRGRWVADRPMRWGERSVISSRRSRVRARWLPRLVGAMAWISSTITASTLARVSRALLVSIR